MSQVEQAIAFGPYRLLPAQRLLLLNGTPLPIRSREFDILAALVAHHDETVSKDQLMALVWPNTMVAENNLTVHISALRKTLGDGVDGKRYIVTIPGRGYRFIAPIDSTPSTQKEASPASDIAVGTIDGGPNDPAAPSLNRLPYELTRLIGRETEIEGVTERLASSQLVTILGAGGIGKTRIALAVAQATRARYSNGVCFVELASLVDPALVASALGAALGVEPRSNDALACMRVSIADKKMLIVLDNCEHLIDGVAEVTESLLRSCPNLHILATSREPLRVEGETLYSVTPLALPPSTNIGASDLGAYAATSLFLERAASAVTGFVATDHDAPAIAEICRSLDGIPLAIEMAAARLRLLTPAQLAAQLDEMCSILTGGRRAALPRQQTMRATIDWSYKLLNPAEQDFFARLSVFAGCWSAASATAVAAGDGMSPAQILDLIGSLVDKSLIQADLGSSETRYRMLAPIRSFATTVRSGENRIDDHRRLALWLVKTYERAESDWPVMPDEDWFRRYEPDLDNLRAGLRWAFGPDGNIALGLELVSHTEHVWTELSLIPEQDKWFGLATAHLSDNCRPDIAGRLWLGRCGWSVYDDEIALDASARAASLFRAIDDKMGLGRALWRTAYRLLSPTDVSKAEPYLEESGRLLRSVGTTKALISWLRVAALSRTFSADWKAARAFLDEALTLARKLRTDRDIALVLGSLADLQFASNSVDEALATADEAIAAFGNHRDRLARILHIEGAQASYWLVKGELDAAAAIARNCLSVARAHAMNAEYLSNIERLALIATLKGNAYQAAHLYGYVTAHQRPHEATRAPSALFIHERLRSQLAEQIPSDVLDRLRAEGALMTDTAIEEALQN